MYMSETSDAERTNWTDPEYTPRLSTIPLERCRTRYTWGYLNPPVCLTSASDIFGICPVVPNSAAGGSIMKSCPGVMSFGRSDMVTE